MSMNEKKETYFCSNGPAHIHLCTERLRTQRFAHQWWSWWDNMMNDNVKNTQWHVMIVSTATREALATFTLTLHKESFIWTASESQLKANTLLHTHHFTSLEHRDPLQEKKRENLEEWRRRTLISTFISRGERSESASRRSLSSHQQGAAPGSQAWRRAGVQQHSAAAALERRSD